MTAQRWTPEYEIDLEWKLWHLANFVKNHANPRDMAARLEKRHGNGLIKKLRARLRAGAPTEAWRPLA